MSKSELKRLAVQRETVHKITTEQVQPVTPGEFCAEASELGLKPGVWPDAIAMTNRAGEVETFRNKKAAHHAGEFSGFEYVGGNHNRLLVLND